MSKSSEPPALEDIKIENALPSEGMTNVAFIAKEFNISEFQNDTKEITLQVSRNNRQKKREPVEIHTLRPSATYRTTQMNTDEFGVSSIMVEIFHE